MMKLNSLFLNLLIISCCLTRQMTSAKIMIIGDGLTDTCSPNFNKTLCPAINLTRLSVSELLNGNFCTVNVKLNTYSLGHCNTLTNQNYTFNISNIGGRYRVRMNEIAEGVRMWFFSQTSQCLPSGASSVTGSLNTCPTPRTTTGPANTSCANVYCPYNGCVEGCPVDPGDKCRNATNDGDVCNGEEENKYILYFNGSEWTCVACVNLTQTTTNSPTTTITPTTQTTTNSPTTTITPTTQTTTNHLTTQTTTNYINTTIASSTQTTTTYMNTTLLSTVKPPEMTLTLPMITIDNNNQSTSMPGQEKRIEPSVAAKVLDKMDSLLDTIEKNNKTNAAIKMGDVFGVLQIQPKNTETKDINICYSSQQSEINVVETNQKTDFPWSVKIPSEAFDKSRQQNNGSAFVGVLHFNNMGNKVEKENLTVLNNEVYGVTMGANISNLTNNIEMIIKQKKLNGTASCRSWDGNGNLNWTTFGCETEMIDNNTINCSCSHLTFFAVLMSPIQTESNTTVSNLETLTLISSIGCGISIFFLSIALFMHFLLRKAKSNQATKILMNMFVALFLLNMSFLSNESVANSGGETACVFIALLMHYSMLATFTWFFIQALHMYLWLIRKNVSITNYMRKITVFGWVFASPAVIAVVSIQGYGAKTITSSSGKISNMCWITNSSIHYIVNIGFYALVFIFTSGIFIMIVFKIFQARHLKTTDGKKITFRKLLMMVLSLFLLFGLTWAVAFFSYGPMLIPSYYIFSVLNSLQGFFLFLYYIHIHNDVAGTFSDDPQNSVSTTSITKPSVTAVENIYN